MRVSHHCNRGKTLGFATFVAVVFITMVGTALLALTLLVQADARRSMRHGAETQLRQLLVAGGVAAMQQVETRGSEFADTMTLQPPTELEDAGLVLTFATDGFQSMRVTVTARCADYEAVQAMRFELEESRWVLRETDLIRQH